MNKINQAVQKFENDFNCAQSVLSSFSSDLGIDEKKASDLALSFGAGIAYRGEMCGAVSGALMAIGLKIGQITEFEELKKELSSEYSKKFLELYEKEKGFVLCKKLLGKDLSKPEELLEARENNLFTDVCPKLVEFSAGLLIKIFEEIDNEKQELLS